MARQAIADNPMLSGMHEGFHFQVRLNETTTFAMPA